MAQAFKNGPEQTLGELVAAGVALVCHQHQTWPGRSGFRTAWLSEGADNSEHCDVGGDNAEADGGDYGEAEDDRHQERDHGRKILVFNFFELAPSVSRVVQAGVFNFACVDAPR